MAFARRSEGEAKIGQVLQRQLVLPRAPGLGEQGRVAAQAAGVDMPIAQAVAALLEGSVSVDEVVDGLLARPLRSESF